MAIISKTPADVRVISDVQGRRVIFGEAVSPGDPVYLKSSDSKHYKCVNTALESSRCRGISISYGEDGTYGYIVSDAGTVVDVGGTATQGTVFVVSSTAGEIEPDVDLATTEYITILGVGNSSSQLQLNINITGIQHP